MQEIKMGNFTKTVTDSEFEQNVLKSDTPVLVDFWAEWCGPCRMLSPSVEAVAEQFDGKAGVYKMNVDENMNVPQQYGIRGIPTLIVFKGGQEQERIVGAVSREAITKVVEKYVDGQVQDQSASGSH
ncbi:MAG TPA: thioredoxin [Pyrinomonadaceae bacterium]